MPKILSGAAPTEVLRDAAIGFHGKIPARGDFVQAGLPRAFTDPWDGWMQRMVAASRAVLGEAWLRAWLEMAVWRFALSSGICGPGAVIGLWMPSVDRVGRYFPLTLAAVARDADTCGLLREGNGFLAIFGFPNNFHVWFGGEERLEALANQGVIVCEQD